ncbi:MAG: small subunit ribosomal protein S8 [Flavobacteriaceae bacterium]|jgi:small subunit ribosomal protein S8
MYPLGNMMTMLKNAGNAGKETVTVPFSNFSYNVARALVKEGFVVEANKRTKEGGFDSLEVKIMYKDNEPKIQSIKLISKPSRRLYAGVKDIKTVRHGHGHVFLSTPKGIMTGRAARKEMVGGELLFEIF